MTEEVIPGRETESQTGCYRGEIAYSVFGG